MKFDIIKDYDNSEILFQIDIEEDKFDLWYKECVKRLIEIQNIPYWSSEYCEYIKKTTPFNIEETKAISKMSFKHFKAMDEFLYNSLKIRIRDPF